MLLLDLLLLVLEFEEQGELLVESLQLGLGGGSVACQLQKPYQLYILLDALFQFVFHITIYLIICNKIIL